MSIAAAKRRRAGNVDSTPQFEEPNLGERDPTIAPRYLHVNDIVQILMQRVTDLDRARDAEQKTVRLLHNKLIESEKTSSSFTRQLAQVQTQLNNTVTRLNTQMQSLNNKFNIQPSVVEDVVSNKVMAHVDEGVVINPGTMHREVKLEINEIDATVTENNNSSDDDTEFSNSAPTFTLG